MPRLVTHAYRMLRIIQGATWQSLCAQSRCANKPRHAPTLLIINEMRCAPPLRGTPGSSAKTNFPGECSQRRDLR